MNIQRITALIKKDTKMKTRQPAVLFLLFLFPLVLTGAFGFAFGSFGGSSETVYTVGIVDNDESNWSGFFTGNLSENEVINTRDFDDANSANDELEQGNLDAYIIIPNNFAESIDLLYGSIIK
jgi:ABC-type Na+ efflux pump permease subunit